MLKNKTTLAIAGIMTLVGALGGTALIASAQGSSATTAPTTVTSSSSSVDKPESPNDPADTDTGKTQGHRPLGGDGVVSSISGTTIVVSEESDESGASYTVDASKAKFSGKDGASATIADIKVGDKIFVDGPVSGNTVAATSISLGHGGGDRNEANDTDGGSASEGAESPSASDAGDQ